MYKSLLICYYSYLPCLYRVASFIFSNRLLSYLGAWSWERNLLLIPNLLKKIYQICICLFTPVVNLLNPFCELFLERMRTLCIFSSLYQLVSLVLVSRFPLRLLWIEQQPWLTILSQPLYILERVIILHQNIHELDVAQGTQWVFFKEDCEMSNDKSTWWGRAWERKIFSLILFNYFCIHSFHTHSTSQGWWSCWFIPHLVDGGVSILQYDDNTCSWSMPWK
jgi:hypothetical protein